MIQTKSFQLSVYSKGDPNASKGALVLPGRLDSKDYIHVRVAVEYFAEKGYCAVTFDPPGTWESLGGIELYTMTNYLKAVDELIEYFGNKPTVLMGHSRGGTVAMLAGKTNPHVSHIIAVMSGAGGTRFDMPKKTGEVHISYRDMPPGTEKTKKQKRFCLPYAYFHDAARYDALEGLQQCVKSKLFFLGLRDTIVSPETVRKEYEIAAEPKALHELDGDHDYRYHPDIMKEVNEVVGNFLDDYPVK